MAKDHSKENAETAKKWPIGCRILYKGKDRGIVTGHNLSQNHLEVVGAWSDSGARFQFSPRSKYYKPLTDLLGLGPRFLLKDVGKPYLELWHRSGRFVAHVHYNTPNIVPFDGATYLIETPWSSADGEYHFYTIVLLGKIEILSDVGDSKFVGTHLVNPKLPFDPKEVEVTEIRKVGRG